MKNIFLKETNQESELYHNTHANVYGYSKNVLSMGGWVVNQFIYITNDEEIEEDVYGIVNEQVGKVIITDAGYEFQIGKYVSHLYGDFYSLNDVCKKIVLTNDTSLIEDGVQEVSSQFLSFFAENPIDYVEVRREEDGQYIDYLADGSVVEGVYENYSLIFPPKVEQDIIMELKKDPLLKEFDDRVKENISSLKSKQEKLYTEEEVLELLKKFAPHIRYNHKEFPHTWSQVVQEWFAENKK
jgi:hypothetical protein